MEDYKEKEDDPSNIFTLELVQKDLREIPKFLLQYVNLKSLDLSCNMIVAIKERYIAMLKDLKELKIYANKLNCISGLQKLKKLEILQFQFNEIATVGSSLKGNGKLKVLRLDGNKIASLKAEELCGLVQLAYIDVSSNLLNDIDCFNVLSGLEELHCTHNNITKIPILRSLSKLRYVDLSKNKLIDVSGLKGLTSLMVLYLNHNCLTNLKSLGDLKHLYDLHLKGNRISDTKHLVEQFPSLEILDLSHNEIANIISIDNLQRLDSLKELSLEGNHVMTAPPETKLRVLQLLSLTNHLDMLDGQMIAKTSKKVGTHIMRPMSAAQGLSFRILENQVYSEDSEIEDLKKRINNTFINIREVLDILPRELPNAKSRSLSTDSGIQCSKNCKQCNRCTKEITKDEKHLVNKFGNGDAAMKQASCASRPSSRCNRRSRIEDAKQFAADNF